MLCDLAWLDPDMEVANGIAATEQSDMLRLDAMILMVQLNIRKLIEVLPQLECTVTVNGALVDSHLISNEYRDSYHDSSVQLLTKHMKQALCQNVKP